MYSVTPLECGIINSDVTKGGLTLLHDEETQFPIPVIVFLVTADDPDDDFAMIVDTGVDQPDPGETLAGREITNGGPEPIREGLTAEGLEPADVDHVVLTHLHYDHACNNDLFPEAEFLVQRTEWEAAHDPLPTMRRVYFDEHLEELEELDVTLLDGGYRLREGIELLPAPGHTAGMQAVVVETADGPLCIISDLAYCQHNIQPGAETVLNGHREEVSVTPSELPYIAPGLNVSVADCYESMDRIEERIGDGVMLGGHVAEILGRTYPE
jgi:glyoxylase-like metal-dependent hydrolase (beta-lactamase superfamily II)